VLEIVAPDEPGLLHRISHGIAAGGCAIDLVLIATEGHRAVDVFHITKNGAKLTEADQEVVAANLQRLVENKDEDKDGNRDENRERNKEESE
jgi:[protein-PII] uridylyltransferase